MLMEVRNNIRYFFNAVKISMKSAMAYKASFFIQAIFMVMNNAFFLVFWGVVFSNTGETADVTFNNVLLLWSFSNIAYGVTYFFFGGVTKINEYIITGAMDSYLLQPKNALLNVATSKCIFSACGDIIYGIIMGIMATGGNILQMLFIIFVGTFGGIFFLSIEIITRSLAVWLGDTQNIANRYTELFLVNFSMYPEGIFSGIIKVLLYTVIPAAYLTYIPSKIIVQFDIRYLFLVILVGVVYFGIAIYTFKKAMKHYESGNSMAMKD